MSKAFQCDNCLEFYGGDPALVDGNHNEFCSNCVRVMSILGKIDPFAYTKTNEEENDYGMECLSPRF